MTLILPNLIIAGASKCGTTSLFEYLAAHPQVCASSVKETTYLVDPGYPLYKEDCNYHRSGLEGYAQFFQCCDSHGRDLIMEATPDYLYQQTPLQVLPMFDQLPSVVFIFRKPSERVFSMYQFARYNMRVLDERISFREFLDMISKGHPWLKGRTILSDVVEHGKYANYLSAWHDMLGVDRVHVLLFENMVTDTPVFMKQLSLSLGIDAEFYQDYDFTPRNESVVLNNRFLHSFKQKAATILPKGGLRTMAGRFYRRINTRKPVKARSEEDIELLAWLDEFYAPFNDELQRIADIDVGQWK